MSYGLNAVLKQVSNPNDAGLDQSDLQPPACDGAPSTRWPRDPSISDITDPTRGVRAERRSRVRRWTRL